MLEEMAINGKKLLPIKELVGRTKYTRDYIAKLAREGQVVGVQVGRQWFIDEASLLNFAEASELEMQVRRRHLSQERKREREAKREFKNEWDVVATHPRYAARRGVTQTLAVIACGLFSGYALYTLPVMLLPNHSLQKAQSPLPETVATLSYVEVTELHALPVAATIQERVMFTDTHSVEQFATATTGVLLVPTAGDVRDPEAIAALFSDPVEVAIAPSGEGRVRLREAGESTMPLEVVAVPVSISDSVESSVVTTSTP